MATWHRSSSLCNSYAVAAILLLVCTTVEAVCPPGTYKGDSTVQCVACPKAFYSNTADAEECKQCPPGMVTKITGASSIRSCAPCRPTPQGQPQVPQPDPREPHFDSLTCQPCEKDHYVTPGTAFCAFCPRPRFVNNYRSCELCPLGTWWLGGRNVKNVGQACMKCAYNQYQDVRGDISCKNCPTGTFVLQSGSASRSACKPYLRTKRLSLRQEITAVQTNKAKLSCTGRVCTYRTTEWVRKTAVVGRTITSGKTYTCNDPLASWISTFTGGLPRSLSVQGQTAYCHEYTLYIQSGRQYSLWAKFDWDGYGFYYKVFNGRLPADGGTISFQFRQNGAKNNGDSAVVAETVKWANIRLI